MKIVYFGTSDFAVPALEAIHKSKIEISLVVTQPARKSGRGQNIKEPPVKVAADGMGLEVYQVEDIKDRAFVDRIKMCEADVFVVVSFGKRLTEELLDIPARFSITLHASLLPKYRGAAPINWALINGEEETGVTVIAMTGEIDAGDILLQRSIDIDDEDDAEALSGKLSRIGAEALIEALDMIKKDKIIVQRQDGSSLTSAPKLKKDDGEIDWSASARDIHNKIRGLVPWPCAFTYLDGKLTKIWRSGFSETPVKDALSPGSIAGIVKGKGICAATAKGYLIIKELQLEGGRRMDAGAFLAGHKIEIPKFACNK